MLRKSIKINNKFEYTMLTDFSDGNMPAIGGFRKSILDKWCCYLDFASADLISSYITEKNYILHKRFELIKIQILLFITIIISSMWIIVCIITSIIFIISIVKK